MLNMLDRLTEQGVLRAIDSQFAKFVARSVTSIDTPEVVQLVSLASAWLSSELGRGHVCLPLTAEDQQSMGMFGLHGELAQQVVQLLPEALHHPQCWPEVLIQSHAVSDGSQPTPLVLSDGRLYLNRYWQFEQSVAGRILAMATAKGVDTAAQALSSHHIDQLQQNLDQLFPRVYHYLLSSLQALRLGETTRVDSEEARRLEVIDKLDIVADKISQLDWKQIDAVLAQAQTISDLQILDTLVPSSFCLNWQKVAAAVALTRQFAVISGGPGTGKTTTVTKLLAALVMENPQHIPNIMLVAPTGKAAARLTESITNAVKSLPVTDEIKAHIPTQSSTIHRLLGAIPGRVDFRHHKGNPLHLDVLVVDEASMVDLPMMARLLEAMPAHAKLILLGDKDQLASVEAGAVLGDICSFSALSYSKQQAEVLSQLTGFDLSSNTSKTNVVADCLCMLQKSYRFHALSGIGQLAKAINGGRENKVQTVWQQGFKDINFYPLSTDSYKSMINQIVMFYRNYLDAIEQSQSPREVLQAFAQVRLLCALREGDFGVVGLNQRIEHELGRIGKIKQSDETWYIGRPIMISQNDHGLGLYNGDIGIAMLEPNTDIAPGSTPRMKVYFEMSDGEVKGFLPSRLPEHETVYAMTIHKSQGSEFADTVMVLPKDYSPILTRELVYTGVTRAKARLYLYGQQEVMARGIRTKTLRASGLSHLLG
ncbi:TPA: exodeoxyribonuclease V subunit alpha [Photobacterium damselae]